MKTKIIFIFFFLFYYNASHNSINIKETNLESSGSISIPILCYHNVNPNFKNMINTKPKEFEEQMRFLYEQGYFTILSKDIKNAHRFNTKKYKPIIITFDDGKRSIYKWAYPIMEKYNFKGIMFLITKTTIPKSRTLFLEKDEINDLIKHGWEIGSHTCSHPRLNKISAQQLDFQMSESKQLIEKTFNIKVISMAYPYGVVNAEIYQSAARNYDYGYSLIEGNNEFIDNRLMNRYMILQTTTIAELGIMLKSKSLNNQIKCKISNNSLVIKAEIPSQIQIKKIKMNFNYTARNNYVIVNNAIFFSVKYYRDINFYTLYISDDKNIYCISRLIYINKGNIFVY